MTTIDIRIMALKLAAEGQSDTKAILDAAAKFFAFLTSSEVPGVEQTP